ncbi:MAG: hypothetical protein Q4D23_06940 [Bacteroidales bacterium]|nr:hypothetical protein [Bacteroidales bacterium]
MELNELKTKWNELDTRLTQVETVNKKAVRELTRIRTASSLTQLKNRSHFGVFTSVFVSAVMIVFFCRNAEINSIMSPYSIWAIITYLVIASMYVLYRSTKVSQLNVTMPTTQLIERTNKLRRHFLMESNITYISVLVLYTVVFALESQRWIIERGRLIPAILLFLALCALVSIAVIGNKRQNKSMFDEIDNNLKELAELD